MTGGKRRRKLILTVARDGFHMRIRAIWEGRTKDASLRALQAEYAERIRHFADFSVQELAAAHASTRPAGKQLSPAERRLLEKLEGSTKVFLDECGREWTSAEFAAWLGGQTIGGTRDLVFLVGGRAGFSGAFRKRADHLMALSRLSLTRDWARALLLEQIYRGFTILRGYPYSR